MAKQARGLPESFSLDLPEEGPIKIGDFLDEELPIPAPKPIRPAVTEEARGVAPERLASGSGRVKPFTRAQELYTRPDARRCQNGPGVIRYQLNLSPSAKRMLEELVEHVCTYSPESDARVSEVFQGLITVLHHAMHELDLAEIPRRGAWGSVTAKNFPVALSGAFEQAILRSAERRRERR